MPLTLTLGGEIQKILLFLSLWMAKATPTDIVAGKTGGTVTVSKSRDLSMISSFYNPRSISRGKVPQKPEMPTRAIAATKYMESL